MKGTIYPFSLKFISVQISLNRIKFQKKITLYKQIVNSIHFVCCICVYFIENTFIVVCKLSPDLSKGFYIFSRRDFFCLLFIALYWVPIALFYVTKIIKEINTKKKLRSFRVLNS